MSVVDFYGNVPNHKRIIRRSQEKTVDKNKSHPRSSSTQMAIFTKYNNGYSV